MDKDIRNALQRATQAARRLLEKEFGEQLEGIYDILPDGTILSEPGAHLDERQRLVREKIVSAIRHKRAGGMNPQEAVADAVREAAFTTLNRFAALKMLEARKLIQPCISSGDQSSGFKEFTGLAPGLATLPDKGYRLYLERLFDEIGCEVKVLFDRRDGASLLWPRHQALSNLIDILNDVALVSVWEADETIGWIYQYFNGEDERRKMREASQAPRNSRELAVRNQFFTPRYVVEFLTDNTLGRIWYDMMQGKTRIVDRCAYLVRRPTEIFLKDGEDPPAQNHPAELSQAELLKQPVYIPYRKKKDPRDIRLLDPAGGSGHFLLYGFDLFLVIYEEAWHDEEAPASEITGQSLRADFPTIEDLRLAIPGLILRHNLHGIDIDPRAAQIASLALWMRAQRAFNDYGIPRDIRPAIRKTNFVVAEPMPGEEELLTEFIEDLHPKVLGDLVQVVFKNMRLAGEAGSLLKIEEEIHDAIAEAKDIWQQEYMRAVDKHGREMLFSERELGRTVPTQPGLFDVSDTDEQFWDKAENLLIDALHDYAKRAANGRGYQRRLFVEDAERGFAFIDLCRKRYDVVLMNPPFGKGAARTEILLRGFYPNNWKDLYAAFIERSLAFLEQNGHVECITSSQFLYTKQLQGLRATLLEKQSLLSFIELGHGVLDGATVETALSILHPFDSAERSVKTSYIDFTNTCVAEKEAAILNAVSDSAMFRYHALDIFSHIATTPFGFHAHEKLLALWKSRSRLEPSIGRVATGNHTFEDHRFLRLRAEIPPQLMKNCWLPYEKGGEYQPFYSPTQLLVDWNGNGKALQAINIDRNGSDAQVMQSSKYWYRFGLCYSHVSSVAFGPRAMPKDGIFSSESISIFCQNENDYLPLLALLCSTWVQDLIWIFGRYRKIENRAVSNLPISRRNIDNARESLTEFANKAIAQIKILESMDETSPVFCVPDIVKAMAADCKFIRNQIIDILQDICNRIDDVSKKCLFDNQDDIKAASRRRSSLVPLFVKRSAFSNIEHICGLPAAPGRIVSEEWLRARPNANNLPPEGAVQKETIPDPEYPLDICWNGILVDDPGHPDDIITRIRLAFDVIWQDKAHEIYAEAVEILDPGKDDLRPWFRANFFADHIKRYSKSRRKAPIYWCLSTPSRSYAVWLYYHRFSKDTFYKVLNDCVKPKLQLEDRKLETLRVEIGNSPSPTSTQRKQFADQEKFVAELKTFHDEVSLTAPLWKPDLNDGVIINFAPLWRMAPHPSSWQKECKQTWDALVRGDYDWAHLAMHLWPERVLPKCHKDRSLAIAHGLEESLWEEDKDGKWKPRDLSISELNDLVAARSSRSVKDDLERLMAAPATAGNGGRHRRG